MHPRLEETLETMEQQFRADSRCLGLYLFGSVGRGTDDAYSDLDLVVVVRDDAYEAVKAAFRPLCERLCGPLSVWLPEGERAQFVNYAFLFEGEGELLLADVSLMSGSYFARHGGRPDRILFDPEGLLRAGPVAPAPRYSPETLAPTIAEYWVYAYINGKYWQRGDALKLRYLQETLFRIHVRLLHALYPSEEWSWWPVSLRRLPEAHRERLLAYLGLAEPAAIAAVLGGELDTFSEDARSACRACGIDYPEETERAVRAHLRRMGLPVVPPRA
jgi:hypothetical protein